MTEVVAHVRKRWMMSVEARALVLLTAVLISFGLVTVYSASAIVAEHMGRGHASFLKNQLIGALSGVVFFWLA